MSTQEPIRPLQNRMVCSGLAFALVLALGCASPIGVDRISPEKAHQMLTRSVLSDGQLSESSRNVFRRANLLQVYENEPELALTAAHRLLTRRHRGRLTELGHRALVAVAEGCFLHAIQSGDRRYFLQSAIYAWAFLFADDARLGPLDPLDPQVRLAANLYNRGLALVVLSDEATKGVKLRSGTLELPIGSLEIELDPEELRWGDRVFRRFTPLADLQIRGLQNRYRDAGIGAPLAASTQDPDEQESTGSVHDPIHEGVLVPVSLVLVIDDVLQGLDSGELTGHIEIHSDHRNPSVEQNGRAYPAEFEPSASLALMLSQIQPWRGELKAFFQGDLQRERDGVVSLSLHERGRIPVVLVHGTASSSATWANMLNDLLADPEIRDRYEFWLFTYNTGAPILYSASLLRSALREAVEAIDPDGDDRELRRVVVIGHSQGGLLTKLQAVNSGDVFWQQLSDEPIEALAMEPETRELITSAIFVEPSPLVSRLVFIATPHRGSYLLNYGVTNLLRSLVRAPSSVARAGTDLVTQNPESAAVRRIDDVEGSLGQMNPSSPFLERLLQLEPEVPTHSIIAVKEFEEKKDDQSDGVVNYESAHLADVDSEVLVQSGHSCLENPLVIEEVRRILLMNLGPRVSQVPGSQP